MQGKVPHLVQYQGSKRALAPQILRFFPQHIKRLIEPFAGMAAITIATASAHKAQSYLINDLNGPLVGLLREAIERPQKLVDSYTALWEGQFQGEGDHLQHFYEVRDRFNAGEQTPEVMLYLLARCVKGAVRYGKNGHFNQSPDKRRHGTNPRTLAPNAYAISALLKGKTTFASLDYKRILEAAVPGDLIYMDPPYQGVSNVRDNRYVAGVEFMDFVESIYDLDRRGIDYVISYDGTCGTKGYGQDLPSDLNCRKIMLKAGLSTQAVLLGRKETTFEALYVSTSLLETMSDHAEQLHFMEMIG